MIKTTLQTRLILLVVISSVFLISAFTIIQLNNQLKRATEFNLYRAKSGALITRDRLYNLFSTMDKSRPPEVIFSEVKGIFSSLVESDVIEKATLMTRDAVPVVTEGMQDATPSYDSVALGKISQIKDKSRWLFPFVDKKRRRVNLFVVVENARHYVVKLTFSLGNLQQVLNEVYVPVIFTVLIVALGNVVLATLLSRALVSPVKLLNQATKDIASGDLDRKVSIETQDELQELAGTFNYMTAELKKMRAKAENANPLTKLPGNIVIQEEVEKKIKRGEKFILLYCDLDNFKVFNDRYGVHAGDKAIMLTADIFKEAIAKEGKAEDFIGHEGGDDFLLLTAPERSERIGRYIIEEFDRRIRTLYSEEDLERGYIESKSRESGRTVRFPITTISLAGVTNIGRKIDSYSQLTNIAAEVKKIAKRTDQSVLFVDRRKADLGIAQRRTSASR